jgi:L-asparaginase II
VFSGWRTCSWKSSPPGIASADSLLAQVVRSGFVEAVHEGAVCIVDTDGRVTQFHGDITRRFFVRSSAKPFQAAVTLELGGPLSDEEIAITCSSHDGDPAHVALIEGILESVGLTEDDLECPPDWPGSPESLRRVASDGHRHPRRIWQNCSGKHAGMLRACVGQGWPTAGYTQPDHPVQRAIAAGMIEVLGADTVPVGVDGCGAPVFRGDTATLAAAFARLVSDPRHERVATAMARFPALTSGARHADLPIAVWLGGVAKRGAEGCLGVALPGRGALAVKVWDGSERAVAVAALAALDFAGWIPEGSRKNLESELHRMVLGGGQAVGAVVPAFAMEQA